MYNYRDWYRKKRKELEKVFGGCCSICKNKENLEFAHILPTKLNGKSRGSFKRLQDIKKHPFSYRLLCVDCHSKFDNENKEVEWVHSITYSNEIIQ